MCSLWATAFQNLLLIYWMIISFKKRKSIKYFISIFELQLFSQLSEIVMDSHMLIKTSVWAGYLGACVIVCFSFRLFCLRLREPQVKRKCLHWAGLRAFSQLLFYMKKLAHIVRSICGQVAPEHIRNQTKETRWSKPVCSVSPQSLLQFLPPGPFLELLP